MAEPDRLALLNVFARIVAWTKHNLGFSGPRLGAMLEDAAKFRRENEECRRQAALTDVPSSKAQWLLFADEWLKQAQPPRLWRNASPAQDVAAK